MAPPDSVSNTPSATKKPVTVLVVDDDLVTLELMRMFVEGLGLRVLVAACLAEARKIAASEIIEILISDLSLPDGEGKELMKELHDRSRIYGIAATGYDADESLKEMGFATHMTKPIDFDHLEEVLNKAQAWVHSAS